VQRRWIHDGARATGEACNLISCGLKVKTQCLIIKIELIKTIEAKSDLKKIALQNAGDPVVGEN
jgi:hypothetical protein